MIFTMLQVIYSVKVVGKKNENIFPYLICLPEDGTIPHGTATLSVDIPPGHKITLCHGVRSGRVRSGG